jgi:OPA family glycerol-3-phosphate transporter-like MFS transporter
MLNEPVASPRAFPEGFTARRTRNWLALGFMYASYYVCRYNLLSVANKKLTSEFGWKADQWGVIINATLWAYAIGQLINGVRVDRLGGRKMILLGALGVIAMNVALGCGVFVRVFTYFIVCGALLGFFQSHGAPSIVKVNGNWFRMDERGTFTGIFGLMIQFGRWIALVGGGWLVARAPWPWLFWAPAALCAIAAAITYMNVRDNPEDLDYPPVETSDVGHGVEDTRPLVVSAIIMKVVKSPVLWIIAAAYFCTGVIRWGVDSWYIRYLQETYDMKTDSFTYMVTAFFIPIAAVAGSFMAGLLSDKVFGARRGPAAAIMYFGSLVMLYLFIHFPGPKLSVFLLVVLQMFINGPHSLLGGAAAMDFGGRKASGFASGLIDCFQYLGGGLLAGSIIGRLIQQHGNIEGSTNIAPAGWHVWITVLMVFAALGTLLMATLWNAHPAKRRGH